MNFILGLIPAPYRWALWLALALAIFAAGSAAGWKLSSAHYQPQVEAANQKLGECSAQKAAFEAATSRQNAAVAEMVSQAKQRAENAAKALKAARDASNAKSLQAISLMGLRPPSGKEECAAARDSFDEELRQERGK